MVKYSDLSSGLIYLNARCVLIASTGSVVNSNSYIQATRIA